ncbi:MAG TPA: nicotinamide riboside transporter PnuC [Terracidiphilus sp.]|jgi:nicotinamide mononucleotide transporter
MTWIEILGFVTGAVSVAFAVRESAWNWPVGIANNVFFFVLFWKAKLYADALLQVVYVVISVYGWWNWLRGGDGHSKLPIAKTQLRAGVFLLIITALSTGAMAFILRRFTDSQAPLGDGVTTALSLTAQYMLSRKLIENWWVWMAADVIYIFLYCYKSLYLAAILYAVFFAMCIAGYAGWHKSLPGNGQTAEVVQ